MSDDERLIELEIRLTHQQTTIDELNSTVYEQWQVIEKLTKELEQIKQRLKAAQPSDIEDVPYIPPHY